MKLSDALVDAFNAQITLELQSSIDYRQLSIEADALGYVGTATWFRIQSGEEVTHAERFIAHLDARDNHAVIGALTSPAFDTAPTFLDLFKTSLAQEIKVSTSIRNLVHAAEEAGDLDSRPLLDGFLSEQIEEESTVRDIITRIELAGSKGPGLLIIDGQLGHRG
ncbi:ferritin [Propionibacterium sp.]|uniref:ferritin n=1 Tax=Propionibacterium sp. TaxID=1977903 RepID=UPI0039ED7861